MKITTLVFSALVLSALAFAPGCGDSMGAANAPGRSPCEQQCEAQGMGCESSCTAWNERVCMQGCDNRRANCLARCQ